MTSNKNTITVELPIEVEGGKVHVEGVSHLPRSLWRKIAADPGLALLSVNALLAPAVVEWMDRDEWKPQDIPAVGRQIEATLRSGETDTFKVASVRGGSARISVIYSDSNVRYFIDLAPSFGESPTDILDWEYVNEPKHPALKEGDWVLVGEDPYVYHGFQSKAGVVVGPDTHHPDRYTVVKFPGGETQIVDNKYLSPAKASDADWKVGHTVPAGTDIGREWVGEFKDRRSLFGNEFNRTSTTARKIVWLGESND